MKKLMAQPAQNQHDDSTPPAHLPISLQRQLTIECSALFLVLSVAWPYYLITLERFPWFHASIGVGAVAFAIARFSRNPWWWQLIHAVFAPSMYAAQLLAIDPKWYLVALVLSSLVFRGAVSGRIPLFLTNRQTIEALSRITRVFPNVRFLDLGAGTGRVVGEMANRNPDGRFVGIENAPVTWLFGRLRLIGQANCRWHYGDLWKAEVAGYDVVYAFLSPEPMAAVWKKATQEMADGSVFVSNSFAIPGVDPTEVIDVSDRRRTQLFCYRISHS